MTPKETTTMTEVTGAQEVGLKPCGGCGAKSNSERCMGCLHDFGTPDSAWVRKYGNTRKESDHD